MKVLFTTTLALFSLGAFAEFDKLVEFHIPNGTGKAAWNTLETVVEVRIGDTLRIVNDDVIPHTLHTFGRPCPHQPTESKSGEFYDCEITTPADPRIDKLYDHDAGEKARFFLKAVR